MNPDRQELLSFVMEIAEVAANDHGRGLEAVTIQALAKSAPEGPEAYYRAKVQHFKEKLLRESPFFGGLGWLGADYPDGKDLFKLAFDFMVYCTEKGEQGLAEGELRSFFYYYWTYWSVTKELEQACKGKGLYNFLVKNESIVCPDSLVFDRMLKEKVLPEAEKIKWIGDKGNAHIFVYMFLDDSKDYKKTFRKCMYFPNGDIKAGNAPSGWGEGDKEDEKRNLKPYQFYKDLERFK